MILAVAGILLHDRLHGFNAAVQPDAGNALVDHLRVHADGVVEFHLNWDHRVGERWPRVARAAQRVHTADLRFHCNLLCAAEHLPDELRAESFLGEPDDAFVFVANPENALFFVERAESGGPQPPHILGD